MQSIDWSAIIGSVATWLLYVLISYLANRLPQEWALTRAFARFVYTGRRFKIVPVEPQSADAAPEPASDRPTVPRIPLPCIMMSLALISLLTGCAGSFELARAAHAPRVTLSAAPDDRAYCRSLDSERRKWDGIAVTADAVGASGVIAGAVGFAREDVGWGVVGLLAGAAVAASGVLGHSQSAALSETWVRECSQ